MLVSAASALGAVFPRVADLAELAWAIGEVFKSLEVLAMLLLVWLIFDRLAPAKGPPVAVPETRKKPSLVVILLMRESKSTPGATMAAAKAQKACKGLGLHRAFLTLDARNKIEDIISPGLGIPRNVANWALGWAERAFNVKGKPIDDARKELQKPINFTPEKCRIMSAVLDIPFGPHTKFNLENMGFIDMMYDKYTEQAYTLATIQWPGCQADKKIATQLVNLRQ